MDLPPSFLVVFSLAPGLLAGFSRSGVEGRVVLFADAIHLLDRKRKRQTKVPMSKDALTTSLLEVRDRMAPRRDSVIMAVYCTKTVCDRENSVDALY